jgi:hypothetical protein
LCKIVHKLTENARFFTQKPHFLHIFAGGRDDFLAGPFWGFSGSGRVARGTLFVSRFSPQKNAQPIEPCSISKIARFTYEAHRKRYGGVKGGMVSAVSVLTNAPNRTRDVGEGNDFRG